jgi:hypothetical protein
MRLQLIKIDHGDGTLDIVWWLGRNQYVRTVNAIDIDTRAKAGAYILSQLAQIEDVQEYILEAHQEAGAWVLDGFTADEDRDLGRGAIKGLPGWATWDAGQAEDWIQINVTDLASAKTALKAMAKMLIYLRDAVL